MRGRVVEGDAYDCISRGLEDGGREHKEKNMHAVMLAGVLRMRNKSGFWITLRGGFAAAHHPSPLLDGRYHAHQ